MYYGKLKFLDCGKITSGGWLKEQLTRSKDGMGGHLDELEPEMLYDPYVKKSACKAWSEIAAPGWGAEISGNFWCGLITLAFTLPDKALQEKAANWVDKVLLQQEEDGYLGTYKKTDDRGHEYNAWGCGCGMKALTLYAEATNRQDVFDAVYRGLLWFCNTDKWKFQPYSGWYILRLMSYYYLRYKDKKLLDYIHRYEEFLDIEENDSYRTSTKALGDDKFFYNQHHAAGYAVAVARPAAVYLADGQKKRLNASINAIEKLHKHTLLVNGGISGTAEWLSPKSATAETEYCTSTFINASYALLAAATGNAIYGDYMENVVFNVAQGAKKKDERAIAYFTSPNLICVSDHSSKVNDPHGMYAPMHITSCCAVNSTMIMPEFTKNLAMTDKNDDLYIISFAPCKIRHKNAIIEVDTLYPFRRDIKIKISTVDGTNADFSLYLKKPYWCADMEVSADSIEVEGNFIRIEDSLENDCEINVKLNMDARVVEMDDTDGADKHPLSVKYGPLCFCLPIKEKWINEGSGYAFTKLPDDWAWYSINAVSEEVPLKASKNRLDGLEWNFATTKEKLESSINVFETEPNGYPWEKPPINITVDGWHAPYLYNHYTPLTNDFYGKTAPVSFEKTVKLVPFGCTNLRITCFPKADIK